MVEISIFFIDLTCIHCSKFYQEFQEMCVVYNNNDNDDDNNNNNNNNNNNDDNTSYNNNNNSKKCTSIRKDDKHIMLKRIE